MDVGYLRQSFSSELVNQLFQDTLHSDALVSHYYPDIDDRIEAMIEDDVWCDIVTSSVNIRSTSQLRKTTRWAFICLTHLFGHNVVEHYLKIYPKEFIGAGVVATTDDGLFRDSIRRRGAIASWIGTFVCCYAIHRHDAHFGPDNDPDIPFILSIAEGFLNREVNDAKLRRHALRRATKLIFSSVVAAEDDIPPDKPHTSH